jgi:superkiller protein 3
MFYMAQQIEPENAEAYAALADSLLDRNLLDKAVWCLREAARLDPLLPGVQSRLAEAYAQSGRHERARQLFLRELRQNPGDLDTLLDLGCLLVDMNRHAEAGEKFRRVLELEPDNADAHFYLADLADRQGVAQDAEVHLSVVLRLDREYPGARRRLASIKLADTDDTSLDTARLLLRQDLMETRRDPTAFEPADLLDLGSLLLDAGLPVDAASVLRMLLTRRRNDVRGRHLLSVAYFEMGRRDLGMREARRVLRLDPRYVPTIHNLALAHFDEGQWLRARSLVRRARLIDPDDASLRRLHIQLRAGARSSPPEGGNWRERCARKIVPALRPARWRALPRQSFRAWAKRRESHAPAWWVVSSSL